MSPNEYQQNLGMGLRFQGAIAAILHVLGFHFLAISLPTVNLIKTSLMLPAKLNPGFTRGKGTVGGERSLTWGVAFAT